MVKYQPDLVRAFRKASLKGWEYAMGHEEEIIDLILEKYNPQKSREHLRFEAEKMRELILPDFVRIGHINPGRWKHIANIFAELDFIHHQNLSNEMLEAFIYDPDRSVHDASLLRKWIWFLAGILAVAGLIFMFMGLVIGKQRKLIAERKQAEEKIRQMAYHDFLTGLPNRKLFSDRLGMVLARAQRDQDGVAVAMLDLDHFKEVNDSCGPPCG